MAEQSIQNENHAICVFLANSCHERDIKRRIAELTDLFGKEDLWALIDKLVSEGRLTKEENCYLKEKLEKYYV